ncbi:MAG: PQQ-binding-like beta-propeller repeat protein [Acidobacteriota bacterium]
MKSCLVVVLLLPVLLVATALAQDFPQWRGVNRDGRIEGAALKEWPSTLRPGWRVEVGIGHSSPLVSGERVYLHSRVGESEVVRALDLKTGRTLWQDSYAVDYTMNAAARTHGKGPKSTPVLAGGRLVTLGITGVLSVYDPARGRLLWRRPFGERFGAAAPLYGTAMSPVVDRGLVILHAGGQDQGGLVALDLQTGQERWAWTGDGPGYASPIVVELAGKRQIVTQSQRYLIGIWIDNGALLWKIPFETDYIQNAVTPIAWRDLLIFSGLNKGVLAYRIGWRNNQWVTDQVWQNREVSMYMNSPVISGSWLFGFSHRQKGQFFCLDLESGRTLWTGDPRQGENAAMLLVDGHLLALTEQAELLVTTVASKGATLVRQHRVADSPTWAHPVLTGRRLLIKEAAHLRVWELN